MLVLCWAMTMDRLMTVDFMIASFARAMRDQLTIGGGCNRRCWRIAGDIQILMHALLTEFRSRETAYRLFCTVEYYQMLHAIRTCT
jgi:hypothetical protein